MTALDPVFAQIVEAFADGIPRPVPESRPEFREAVRLVIELEDTPRNREFLKTIGDTIANWTDNPESASYFYEDSETAVCVSCHEAMPTFHIEHHNCLGGDY
jgi:hypothetical protein